MRGTFILAVGLAVIALVACSGPAGTSEPRPHHVEFRLVNLNMENFFDAYDDPYVSDERSRPKAKGPSIAQGEILREAKPDFLAVQEIENEGILLRFRGWNLPDMGFEYFYVGQSIGSRGINNGFLSRIPVGGVTLYRFERLKLPDDERNRTWRFARDLTAVELMPAGDVQLLVFIAHFKSKLTVDEKDPQSADWRLAEAIRLRRLIDARLDADPEAMIAVLGDLNDTPDSGTIRALLDADANGRVALVDPHKDIPADEAITYLREPYKARVDYTLLSPALAKHVVAKSAKIYNEGDTGSDHAPVGVSLRIPTAETDAKSAWPSGDGEKPLQTFFKPQPRPSEPAEVAP